MFGHSLIETVDLDTSRYCLILLRCELCYILRPEYFFIEEENKHTKGLIDTHLQALDQSGEKRPATAF